MAKVETLESELNDMMQLWGREEMTSFLRDIIPLFELYNVSEDSDWVLDAVGLENEINIRLLRTVYLISKIADNHSGRLCSIKIKHPKLWKKMEETI